MTFLLNIFDFLISSIAFCFVASVASMFLGFTLMAGYGIYHIGRDPMLTRSDRFWTVGMLSGLTLWGSFLTYEAARLVVMLVHHIFTFL